MWIRDDNAIPALPVLSTRKEKRVTSKATEESVCSTSHQNPHIHREWALETACTTYCRTIPLWFHAWKNKIIPTFHDQTDLCEDPRTPRNAYHLFIDFRQACEPFGIPEKLIRLSQIMLRWTPEVKAANGISASFQLCEDSVEVMHYKAYISTSCCKWLLERYP